MNFVADESVDRQVVERLRADGHNVTYILECDPSIGDDVILAKSASENAILITADKDFGELIFRLRRVTAGVILLRLHGVPPLQKAYTVSSVIAHVCAGMVNQFTVVRRRSYRVRPPFPLP